MRERRTDDLVEWLGAAGIDVEPVRMDQRDAFFESDDNRTGGLVVRTSTRPTVGWSRSAVSWDFDDLPLQLDRPAPALGEHNDEIVSALEISP